MTISPLLSPQPNIQFSIPTFLFMPLSSSTVIYLQVPTSITWVCLWISISYFTFWISKTCILYTIFVPPSDWDLSGKQSLLFNRETPNFIRKQSSTPNQNHQAQPEFPHLIPLPEIQPIMKANFGDSRFIPTLKKTGRQFNVQLPLHGRKM